MRHGSHIGWAAKLTEHVAVGLFAALSCEAAVLHVAVVDPGGKPVPEIVVVATPTTRSAASSIGARGTPESAVMDQVGKSFVPEVLIVRTGTAVVFPNSDSIAHQVYSFSSTKRFALPLYRGQPYPPVVFDQPGIVALGCNIHDRMVGYIFVTDSPHFGKTDAHGRVEFPAVAATTYRVNVWSPHLNEAVADREIQVADAQPTTTTVRLARTPRAVKSTDPRVRDY